MSARAVREKRAFVSNKLHGDTRVFFAKERIERGIASMAILPLRSPMKRSAYWPCTPRTSAVSDEPELLLLNWSVRDIAFAIDNIGKRRPNAKKARWVIHLSRVHAMLSGVNSLIVRVKDEEEEGRP